MLAARIADLSRSRLKALILAGEVAIGDRTIRDPGHHVNVGDTVVVGIPHATYGQEVVAAVELEPGCEADERQLVEHVRGRLAAYKAPRRVRVVDSIGRAPNGKVDYGRHQREAAAWGDR